MAATRRSAPASSLSDSSSKLRASPAARRSRSSSMPPKASHKGDIPRYVSAHLPNSVMRVPTLDESLHSNDISRRGARRRSLDFSLGATDHSEHATGSRVSFYAIEVREYARVVGDNPSVSGGPPICIGWEHSEIETLSVEEFESNRPPRRAHHEMAIPRSVRQDMLMYEWGFGRADLASAVRESNKTKNHRRTTVQNLDTPFAKFEEGTQSAKRKVKRAILGRRKSDGALYEKWKSEEALAREMYLEESRRARKRPSDIRDGASTAPPPAVWIDSVITEEGSDYERGNSSGVVGNSATASSNGSRAASRGRAPAAASTARVEEEVTNTFELISIDDDGDKPPPSSSGRRSVPRPGGAAKEQAQQRRRKPPPRRARDPHVEEADRAGTKPISSHVSRPEKLTSPPPRKQVRPYQKAPPTTKKAPPMTKNVPPMTKKAPTPSSKKMAQKAIVCQEAGDDDDADTVEEILAMATSNSSAVRASDF